MTDLLVYTSRVTPRLSFVFKHLCTRILGLSIQFTSSVEEFVAFPGAKISYAKVPLANEVFIQAHNLLFEEGISDVNITVESYKTTKCFFKSGAKSTLPFDIFAASFYLLSRYEEYLPYVADEYGRFPPEESLAYRYNFLKKPVVDIWAYEFKAVLCSAFPDLDLKERSFVFSPVIDVPVAYLYKSKGVMRTLGGSLKDLFYLKIERLYARYAVLLKLRKDPYDTYRWLINIHKNKKTRPVFFFLLATYSAYDKNINPQNKTFRALIKFIGDYFDVGLKGSFKALEDVEEMRKEKKRFEAIINRSLTKTRYSFSKVSLPFAYRNLIDLGVKEDYTMGYVYEPGFRASTCTSFYFYDIDYETQTPLLIHPFAALDYYFLKKPMDQVLLDLKKMANEIKQVDGTFSLVLHNYTFSEEELWKGWRKAYLALLETVEV